MNTPVKISQKRLVYIEAKFQDRSIIATCDYMGVYVNLRQYNFIDMLFIKFTKNLGTDLKR